METAQLKNLPDQQKDSDHPNQQQQQDKDQQQEEGNEEESQESNVEEDQPPPLKDVCLKKGEKSIRYRRSNANEGYSILFFGFFCIWNNMFCQRCVGYAWTRSFRRR